MKGWFKSGAIYFVSCRVNTYNKGATPAFETIDYLDIFVRMNLVAFGDPYDLKFKVKREVEKRVTQLMKEGNANKNTEYTLDKIYSISKI